MKYICLLFLFAVCSNGTFGHSCQFKCHCYNDEQCNRRSGVCPSGWCAAGYNGDNCQEGKVFLLFLG